MVKKVGGKKKDEPLAKSKINDSIDDFADQREKKSLQKIGKSKKNSRAANDDGDVPVMDLDLEVSDDEVQTTDRSSKGASKKGGNKDHATAWGKKKGAFYSGDDTAVVDAEADENLEEAEEEEALRLEKEQMSRMEPEDFDDAFASILFGAKPAAAKKEEQEEAVEAVEESTKKGKKKSSSKKKEQSMELLGDVEVEEVKKDVDSLSKDEKLQLLISESPELLELLEEFKTRIGEVRTQVAPILDRVHAKEAMTDKGISYLEAKLHLLLNYLMDISFYLMLKASGRPVRDHPVISQLVHIRAILEKVRPLDMKLKYQVDKLMKIASSESAAAAAAASGSADADTEEDQTRFRPNLDNMVARADEDDETADGVYKAPKIASNPYEDDEIAAKIKKQKEKAARSLRKSGVLRELNELVSDRPMEVPSIGANLGDDETEEQMERDRYEEDNFVRLTLSKKDKAKAAAAKRKRASALDELDQLEDFGDLAALDEPTEAEQLLEKKRASYKQTVQREMPQEAAEHDDGEDLGSEEEEFYRNAKEASHARKKARKEKYESQGRIPMADAEVSGDKRHASRDIIKNRGLTPYRKKEDKNPRLKMRNKFDKALKKRRTQVREVKAPTGSYGGESTSIKKNLTRSVNLRQ